MINFPEFEHVSRTDPELYQGLMKLQRMLLETASKAGVGVGGSLSAPPQIQSILVTAENGFFDITINDVSAANQGIVRPISYFVMYDTIAGLSVGNSPTISLGPVRHVRPYLGNGTFYFGAYSSYNDSPISPVVSFGQSVAGGGSVSPPSLPLPPAGGISGIGTGGGYGRGNSRAALSPRILQPPI